MTRDSVRRAAAQAALVLVALVSAPLFYLPGQAARQRPEHPRLGRGVSRPDELFSTTARTRCGTCWWRW